MSHEVGQVRGGGAGQGKKVEYGARVHLSHFMRHSKPFLVRADRETMLNRSTRRDLSIEHVLVHVLVLKTIPPPLPRSLTSVPLTPYLTYPGHLQPPMPLMTSRCVSNTF